MIIAVAVAVEVEVEIDVEVEVEVEIEIEIEIEVAIQELLELNFSLSLPGVPIHKFHYLLLNIKLDYHS